VCRGCRIAFPTVVRSSPLIAVVDDDESVRRALERLLRSAGLDAETFPTGDEFLETLPDHKPDCVVLDLHMPKVDGFQVQSWLARANLRVPVIVITGHDTPESFARAMKGGAAAYLRKPIDAERLLQTITTAIEEREETLEKEPT
jgi:FixJ family two-component response regulator